MTTARERTRRGERGQIIPIGGALMVAVMGVAGMVTDIGTFFHNQRLQQNAAEEAAHAAATYWVSRLATATDRDIFCVVQLYSSSGQYRSLPGCPAPTVPVPDNGGRGTTAVYVDWQGTQLGPVGGLGAVVPTGTYPTAAGIRVTTSESSGAFFSRLFGMTGFPVTASATDRIGTAASITTPRTPVSLPSPVCTGPGGPHDCTTMAPPGGPGQWQNGLSVFPAAFQLTTYTLSPRYSPFSPPAPGQIQQFGLQPPCTATADFCWSGLQCDVSSSNSVVKTWLQGTNPCPDRPSTVGTATSPLCTPPSSSVSCQIKLDPGTRAVDFSLASTWAGSVAIIPIVSGAASTQPVIQFAYLFITGVQGNGSHTTISGFFLDPAQLPPLPAQITNGCVPSSGIPCGVSGT